MKAWVLLLAFAVPAGAQDFSYRGFAEVQATAYPQEAVQDDRRVLADARFRFDPAYRPIAWLTLSGSFDARADTLRQVEREWRVDFRDRRELRPALSVREARATIRRSGVSVDAGKQFIRWGKTDILNPTDRFAPRDFMEVTDDEFLGVTGVRVMYERGPQTFDAVWVPLFTPSRTPLQDGRWAAPPSLPPPYEGILDLGVTYPSRAQYGLRWNAIGSGFDIGLAYYDGFNHLPQFAVQPLSGRPLVALARSYAPLRMGGIDAAVPLRWFIVKGEAAAMFTTSDLADDVVLYVVQIERQAGELSLVAGYAGEVVLADRAAFDFAPDRGLTRALLGRVAYTLDATRELAVEMAVRENLNGVWLEGQFSKALDGHWRLTLAAAAIAGEDDDFIGQYRRNSHLLATLRYSF